MTDILNAPALAHLIATISGQSVDDVLATSPLSLILDSLAMLQVLARLEQSYGVTIDETQITPGDFENIHTLVRLLGRLKED